MNTRILAVLLLLLPLHGGAVGQDFMISPDGRYVARHILLPGSNPFRPQYRVELVDIDCLGSKSKWDQCVVVSSPTFERKGNRHSWSSDSTAFLTGSSRIAIGIDGSVTPGALPAASIEPRVIDFTAAKTLTGHGAAALEWNNGDLIANGRGVVVGYQRWEGDRLIVGSALEHWIEIPKLAVVAGDSGSARQWIYPSLMGETFWYWSPTMGQRGRLIEFGPNSSRDVPLPDSVGGPLRLLADEATNHPVALLDAFGIYPLTKTGDALAWLTTELASINAQDRYLLWSVAVSVPARVAFVRLQPGLSKCFEDWLITASGSTIVSPLCGPVPDNPRYSVSYVEVPGALALPGRLYRAESAVGTKRNLIIYLHGGPHSNSLESTVLDGLYSDPRFDVLAIDFRGSTGLGYPHVEALRPPVGDIAAEDLRAAVDWALGRAEYRDGILGVWGSSWGGLSVHAIASRDSNGIDFMISNSGFIENPPNNIPDLCDGYGWVPYVHGASKDADGNCQVAQTGVLGRKVTTRAALLALSSGLEQPGTPFETEMSWVSEAREEGVCVTTVFSESGAHAGARWPESSQSRAREIVRAWIDEVSAKHQVSCGLDFRLQ